MIDIVITYLNEKDEKWQKDYNYYKQKEIITGKNRASNRQAFGAERIREWDTLKYWFRGVEKNCPWVNKVFLIVQNERQVPNWLKKDHPKLRIVYHEEYIPKELLPTFNAFTITLYIGKIKDLSETYLRCDDDFYFINPIAEDLFFKNNKPVHVDNKIPYKLFSGYELQCPAKVFYHVLNNVLLFETKFMKEKVKYGFYHLPEARLKSFEEKILDDYKEEIYNHCCHSRFRHQTNLDSVIFSDLLKICNKVEWGNPYINSSYCTLMSTVNYDDYLDKDMVCFNDTEQLDDYEKTKKKLIEFFEKKFPDKSSFEV